MAMPHSNRKNSLSAYNNSISPMPHLWGIPGLPNVRGKGLEETHHRFGHAATYTRPAASAEKDFPIEQVRVEYRS